MSAGEDQTDWPDPDPSGETRPPPPSFVLVGATAYTFAVWFVWEELYWHAVAMLTVLCATVVAVAFTSAFTAARGDV